MKSDFETIDSDRPRGLPRRDFLKVGVGFSVALTLGTALVGCSDAAKVPATGYTFLRPGDVELFTALAPAVVSELANFDAAKRKTLVDALLRNVDDTSSVLGLASQQELRKLLDLLAIAPLRYVLTGVGAWNEAGIEKMQAFLARWRGSSFATLNAGGNVLVQLTATSFFVLPASWPSAGYPGPLEHVFKAINS